MRFLWPHAVPALSKCLQTLPNLHTLEIASPNYYPCTSQLKKALKGVRLPQIKTLIIPPSAHTLLKRCPNVENVDWVIGDQAVTSSEFLRSLASVPDSKIKRLAIPLILPDNPSSRWTSSSLDRRAMTMTDRLRPQDIWPRAQGLPSSPSSTHTHICTHPGSRIFIAHVSKKS